MVKNPIKRIKNEIRGLMMSLPNTLKRLIGGTRYTGVQFFSAHVQFIIARVIFPKPFYTVDDAKLSVPFRISIMCVFNANPTFGRIRGQRGEGGQLTCLFLAKFLPFPIIICSLPLF